ncbi:hypothetical protein LF1_32050 [Rubripirellula obstinata]|uniref:Uncharacterized protein n=1 Tax=Rubripirellula obstinata TaxID=406547 RepID=A0A5B1CLA4_9BACT|nr:hypothetical protein LF1_32050 [Rubripirellula obstinata]
MCHCVVVLRPLPSNHQAIFSWLIKTTIDARGKKRRLQSGSRLQP